MNQKTTLNSQINHSMDAETFRGQRVVRRLNKAQIQLFNTALEQILKHQKFTTKKQISWITIFKNDKFCLEKNPFWDKFHQYIQQLIINNQSKKQNIHSYGFLNSPANSQNSQKFHVDYANPDICIMFVSMTDHTTKNATQFIENKVDLGPNNYRFDEKQLMEFMGVDHLQILQVIAKPYTLIKSGADTVHRGIGNGEDKDRPLFWVNYSQTDYKTLDNDEDSQTQRLERLAQQKNGTSPIP